jgi:hypothetical protein
MVRVPILARFALKSTVRAPKCSGALGTVAVSGLSGATPLFALEGGRGQTEAHE